jgi:hypothetical protein
LRRHVRQAERGKASVLGRVYDDGIAHGEGRRDRPSEHLSGIVPGNDMGRDAVRHALGRHEHALGRHEEPRQERYRVPMHFVGCATIVLEVAGGGCDVGSRLLHEFAGVARFELRQFIAAFSDGKGKLAQKGAPDRLR